MIDMSYYKNMNSQNLFKIDNVCPKKINPREHIQLYLFYSWFHAVNLSLKDFCVPLEITIYMNKSYI